MFKTELERQIQQLIDKGYPAIAEMSEAAFAELLHPLVAKVEHSSLGQPTSSPNRIPVLLVIKSELVSSAAAMSQVKVKSKAGVVNMTPLYPTDFAPIADVSIPEGPAYLLFDVETGRETLNVTPADALINIKEAGRTPLTIDEGVALVTQFPEILSDKEHFNAFSMLASRRQDKRVPALWISYGQPRLGWCWNENPHTWLGSASAQQRLGVENKL